MKYVISDPEHEHYKCLVEKIFKAQDGKHAVRGVQEKILTYCREVQLTRAGEWVDKSDIAK